MGQVQNSPYSWMSGTLWDEAKDLRRNMLGSALSSLAGAGALYMGGPGAAKAALTGTRLLWDRTGKSWRSWEQNYERPRRAYEEWSGNNHPFVQKAMQWAQNQVDMKENEGYGPIAGYGY